MGKIIIEFEDDGQDFLKWELDSEDRVVDCTPFQGSIWCGKYVFCPKSLYPGMRVEYSDTPITKVNQPLQSIKYKIKSITK